MNKEQKYGTGAIESIKDNRTIQYNVLPQAQAVINIPENYETDITMLPVENQGPIGACVAYALAKIIQYKEYKESGNLIPMSARFIYTIARAISGWTGQVGQGLMPLFGVKAVANGTWDTQAMDDTSLPHSEYEKMTISEAMKAEAYKYRIKGYAQITDVVTLQKAIMNEGLVAISMPYGGGNFNQGLLTPYTITDSRHYIVVYGWQTIDRRIAFKFRNQWTKDWGFAGNGMFFWDEYQGQVVDMFALADVPDEFIETARSTAFQFNVDIPKGSKGPLVTELQKALTDLGYYIGPVTGFYGDMTAQAVTQFQIAQKIPTNNGKNVGPMTRAKLNELLSLLKKKLNS